MGVGEGARDTKGDASPIDEESPTQVATRLRRMSEDDAWRGYEFSVDAIAASRVTKTSGPIVDRSSTALLEMHVADRDLPQVLAS